MQEHGMVAGQKRGLRRTTDSRHARPFATNVLARQFGSAAPKKAWVGDVTYIPTGGGWSYLAVLLDLFSRRVVGDTNDAALALAAPGCAVRTRRQVPAGLVQHGSGLPVRQRGVSEGARAGGSAARCRAVEQL